MRCDDLRLLQQWVLGWRGFGVTFEIVPFVPSKEIRPPSLPSPSAPHYVVDRQNGLDNCAGWPRLTPTIPSRTRVCERCGSL
jgi:hypothetical protein